MVLCQAWMLLFFHYFQCISCTPVDGGTAIECDVGVYIVVKVVSLVQLEVYGRFLR